MPERIRNGKSASLLKPLQAGQFDASRPKPLTCVGPNRDQPWGYRYYEITLSCPARVRAQLAFRVGDDLGVGRPSIYATAFLAGNPVNFPQLARVGPLYDKAFLAPCCENCGQKLRFDG